MRHSKSRSVLRRAIAPAATAALLPALMLIGGMARAAGVPKVVSASLSSVSCKGNSFCLAAGSYSTRLGKGLRLNEAWNGKGWNDVSDPLRGHLFLISCGSPTFCFGSIQVTPWRARAAKWNGRTWQAFKGSAAVGATCGSPKVCMNISGTAIDEWNGKRWKVDPSTDACAGNPPDDPCGYNDISCGSATNCLAIMYACTTQECVDGPDQISTTWNGSSWGSGFSAPFPGSLSCSWGAFCMDTSSATQATIWDNAGWQDASPDLSAICSSAQKCSLNGLLACGAPQDCVVLPHGSPVSLVWSDFAWKAVPLATVHGTVPQLSGLSCGSATNCMAVGSQGTPAQPVAEHWNGTRWQLTKPANH